MEIRAMEQEEQKYTYRQSMQIQGQTGSIGISVAILGAGGMNFTPHGTTTGSH